MKVVFTDYQYEHINQEKEILAAIGATIIDMQSEGEGFALETVLADADAVVVQYVEITQQLIQAMKHCKVIIKYGIGVNNIDVDAATKAGIYVCNVPDYGIDEVSNHAIALMFALHRKLNMLQNAMRNGEWGVERAVPIHRLAGSTVGLMGLGRIPALVAEKLSGLGVQVLAHDPYVSEAKARQHNVALVDFDTLCAQSDIISIHCPLTDETRHIFDRHTFDKMKPGAILINTARGPVVNEAELVDALSSGKLAAAGLDTFEEEPLRMDSPLLQMENVIATPHCAWYSEEAIQILQKKVAEEVANVLSGNQPFNCVNQYQLRHAANS